MKFQTTSTTGHYHPDNRDCVELVTLVAGALELYQVTRYEDHYGPTVTYHVGLFTDLVEAQQAYQDTCTQYGFT